MLLHDYYVVTRDRFFSLQDQRLPPINNPMNRSNGKLLTTNVQVPCMTLLVYVLSYKTKLVTKNYPKFKSSTHPLC